MITDALKYRMAQQSVGKAVTRPVPQVQRPGIIEPRGSTTVRRQRAGMAESRPEVMKDAKVCQKCGRVVARKPKGTTDELMA